MCGRYSHTKSSAALTALLGLDDAIHFCPLYNLCPGQNATIVRSVAGQGPSLDQLSWGLIPFWSRPEKTPRPLINARAETAAMKPAFRGPMRYRRCLVLADGFYEWDRRARGSQAWRFVLESEQDFAFAGLWDYWHAPHGGLLETFSILTTQANDLVGRVHDRMPVILDPSIWPAWLDERFQDVASLLPSLRPLSTKAMKSYPVGQWVHASGSNDPRSILPIELPAQQGELF